MVCLVGMTKNCKQTLLILLLISKINSYSIDCHERFSNWYKIDGMVNN